MDYLLDDDNKRKSYENQNYTSSISWKKLLTGPWVIVKDGNLMGFFDFVPQYLRVGPWSPIAPIYIVLEILIMIKTKPPDFIHNQDPVYPELYSTQWYITLMVAVWTLYVFLTLVVPRPFKLCTYTSQSYMVLTIRYTLTALSPLLDPQNPIVYLNEALRFPSLIFATVTCSIWNLIMIPLLYSLLKTKEKRDGFVKWNLSFHMIQVHAFNIIFSVLLNVMISPPRQKSFNTNDLWFACTIALMYQLFYVFFLDRVGVHFYPILSPRTHFIIITWTVTYAVYFIGFHGWNRVLDQVHFS